MFGGWGLFTYAAMKSSHHFEQERSGRRYSRGISLRQNNSELHLSQQHDGSCQKLGPYQAWHLLRMSLGRALVDGQRTQVSDGPGGKLAC